MEQQLEGASDAQEDIVVAVKLEKQQVV